MMASKSITLTPPEQLFRKCLLDCRKQMIEVPGMKELDIRFAGGWVRDKLLGETSHDIDVALSTMTGERFGVAFKSFMEENSQKYKNEAKNQGFSSHINLHTIKKNPEKSKQLETVTTRVFGIDVDFVNLRKEVYDEHSRNPQMEFGTPQEDALRRDATVNALFFNIHSQVVEDFTGKGLDDMKKKVMRTPLEPYQTFIDDPLRVLRLIRFASRLKYTIDSEALRSMADTRIHEALRLKISRERVGVEVGKMTTGPDPYMALMLIHDLNLYRTVFGDPNDPEEQIDSTACPTVYSTLQKVIFDCSIICLGLTLKGDIGLAWILAAYVPWRQSESAAVRAAREGLKVPNTTLKILGEAVKNRQRIAELVQKVQAGEASRSEVGTTFRNAGPSWRFQTLYALLCDAVSDPLESVIKRYTSLVEYVQEQQLEEVANLKPIINGNEIKEALSVKKAGSWLKSALELVVEWQFENPTGTAEDAKEMIKERKHELDIG